MTITWHLRIGGKPTGLVLHQDNRYPNMWRIHYRGMVSDMVNLARAKDAAFGWLELPPKRGQAALHMKWKRAQTPAEASPMRFHPPTRP